MYKPTMKKMCCPAYTIKYVLLNAMLCYFCMTLTPPILILNLSPTGKLIKQLFIQLLLLWHHTDLA